MAESFDGLKALSDMDYPGRFIMLGRANNDDVVAVYGITGRSAPSQARRLVKKFDFGVWKIEVEPTNVEELKRGNAELLLYTAMETFANKIVVGNGKQTEGLIEKLDYRNPIHSLTLHHKDWLYEPDANYTPRITGCIGYDTTAFCIIKRDDSGSAIRQYFEIPLQAGRGSLIATYTGENKNPLPSFRGEPLSLNLDGLTDSDHTAKSFFDALAPKNPALDFRVSVAAVHKKLRGEISMSIINRVDLEKK